MIHTQLALILCSSERGPIVFFPDDQLAILSLEKKIIIKVLSLVKVCPMFLQYFPACDFLMQDMRIGNDVLDTWKNGQLTDAETLLTAAIQRSTGMAHHILASQALVWVCMRQWDAALVDANEVPSL